MSHTTDQPDDRRHWREFTDRDTHKDRLTHELAGALNDTEDW